MHLQDAFQIIYDLAMEHNEANPDEGRLSMNYRKTSVEAWRAYFTYCRTNPNGPVSAASFLAGFNAALHDNYERNHLESPSSDPGVPPGHP